MDELPPEDAVNALMDRLARPCIRIHRRFLPPRVAGGRSKLGGCPNLPPDMEWPYGRSHHRSVPVRTPLHFMAQIDLSELPPCDGALPTSGMLYFFANMYDDVAWDGYPSDDYRRVLYAPHVAPDQKPRSPPDDMRVINGARSSSYCYGGTAYPEGYRFGHRPDDPLTGKIYYEWPVQFVVTDSYPPTDAVLQTAEWKRLAADMQARAAADTAFSDRHGGGDSLRVELETIYQEQSRDRMVDAFYAAVKLPRPTGYSTTPYTKQKWRHVGNLTQGAFPPIAAFASEIAMAIDNLMRDSLERLEQRDRYAQAPVQTVSGIAGYFRKLLAGGSAPPLPPAQPLPPWAEDLKAVRQAASEWLGALRALAPDEALDPDQRERFLAWLDGLDERKWARVGGQPLQISEGVDFAFDQAMFQLARLAVTNGAIRAHFPEALAQAIVGHFFVGVGAHQMLGFFPSSQAGRPLDDPMVPLLMLSYDPCPDFRICDVGEMQFFIGAGDLRLRNFASVEVQMQGG